MENVTSVGFTSCALRHNAKLPDLDLLGGQVGASPPVKPHGNPHSTGEAWPTQCYTVVTLLHDRHNATQSILQFRLDMT